MNITSLIQKIPLIVKAIISGFIVSTLGITLWIAFATYIPSPWFLIATAIMLWAFWKYFSGSWGLAKTKDWRTSNFRSKRLTKKAWKYGLIAAATLVVFLQSSIVLTFRLVEYPAEKFKEAYTFLAELPTEMAWLVLIMSSLVAGICEEIGYRGYLQAPLEKKYNFLTANIVTSVVFVLIHLHQAWAPPVIFHIFFISMLLGYMAQAFQSLVPGIITHVVFDIFNFSYWWSDILGEFTLKPVGTTGVDLHFIITAIVFTGSLMGFFLTIRHFKSKLNLSPQ